MFAAAQPQQTRPLVKDTLLLDISTLTPPLARLVVEIIEARIRTQRAGRSPPSG